MKMKLMSGCVILALAVAAVAANVANLFEFDKMQGVQGPFVGTLHPIRGITGAGKIWKIGTAKAQLDIKSCKSSSRG